MIRTAVFPLVALFTLAATCSLAGLDLSPEGAWVHQGISGSWRIAMPGWSRFLNAQTADFKTVSPGRGILTEQGRTMEFHSICRPEGDAILLHSTLQSEKFPDFGELDYQIRIPFETLRELSVDGKPLKIPAEWQKTTLAYYPKQPRRLTIGTTSGTLQLQGTFSIMVQDNRKWSDSLSLHLNGEKRKESGRYEVELLWRFTPAENRPIPLDRAANMGFRDDRAGDGTGGWTDQGPENDMATLKPGKLSFAGIDFQIVNPAVNEGKSCLVLSRTQTKFPPTAEVRVPAPGKFPYLYLLHATAWTPPSGEKFGTLRVRYRDGRREDFPLLSGIDGGNWWIDVPFRNAGIAWEGNNFKARTGLYASAFRLTGDAAGLEFHPAGNTVWMICAATLSNVAPKFETPEKQEVIRAGQQWLPVNFSRHTEPDSPLDFSGTLEAPAGKYGRIVVNPAGHFVFRNAPGKRIRFLGVNLCQSANYLTRQEAEEFTGQIARAGYNSVRFHHFENLLMAERGKAPDQFDPQKLDSLHYLMSCLKKRGIYFTLDLYASREIAPGVSAGRAKLLFHIDPAAQENWKRFTRALLTAKNPYTGLSLAEDPALYLVSLVNESNLSFQLPKNQIPEIHREFQKQWQTFFDRHAPLPDSCRKEQSGLWHTFLNGMDRARIRQMTDFLRKEIRTDVLVTDLNFISEYPLSGVRSELQVVDMHAYWDHMRLLVPGRWAPPQRYHQLSALGQGAAHVRIPMPSRVFGRPYVLTEVNYCYPNRFRSEYAPMFGGYAALQDWDGIYRFAWSHARETLNNQMIGGFDIAKDPAAQLADRLVHALFLRGDLSPAPEQLAIRFDGGELETLTPEACTAMQAAAGEFSFLGLRSRIGVLPAGKPFPSAIRTVDLRPRWQKSLRPEEQEFLRAIRNRQAVSSETGELQLNPESNTLRVVTPETEALCGTGTLHGDRLRIAGAGEPQTVALLSLDGAPLAESRKLLLLHLVETANTEQTFRTSRRTVLEAYGKAPLLLRRSRVNVTLRLPAVRRVETLDFSGRRTGSVVTTRRGAETTFSADTALRPHGVMAYLISAD